MSVQNGLGAGQAANVQGSLGSQGQRTEQTRSYSSITAINTSVRDRKNVLEIRLERQQGASFRLSQLEFETLLVRLGISGSEFEGVSACPEGKPVVLITLSPTVNINRFLYRNESYIVKEGVRTTSIRPAGRKDVLVTVSGLHPNTKDQAVIRYLEAHGKISRTEKVIHHVFPGAQGSSLCAGKLNGNRSYVMDIKVPMGSYHILDGEKVTIRYPGQEWSCARCHQYKGSCPGSAVARECTAERVLLSAHMEAHWAKIGFRPETEAVNDVDDLCDLEIQVGQTKTDKSSALDSNLKDRYKSVIVKGFLPDYNLDEVLEVICENGLPKDFNKKSVIKNEKSGALTISNLVPEQCLELMEKMHGRKFLGRKVFVTSVVANSPVKPPAAVGTASATPQASNSIISKSSSVPQITSPVLDPKATCSLATSKTLECQSSSLEEFEFEPPLKDFEQVKNGQVQNMSDMFELPNKRKASLSPESKELSRKDKKAAKKEQKSKNKSDQKARMLLNVSQTSI